MATDDLIIEVADHIATVTLNRPAQKNAMNRAMFQQLLESLQRIRTDSSIRVGVIRGTDGVFCAGADLKERAAGGGSRAEDNMAATVIDADAAAQLWSMHNPKPLIAAVDGYCLAAGFEIALLCDLRICSTRAQFGLPEITRGFFPGGGGPQRLMRAVPEAVAMDLLLLGERMSAQQALQCGLVSRMVEADALDSAAAAMARRVAGFAPLAVRAAKEVARAAQDAPLHQAMRLGASLRWVIGQTEDAKEGPRAFTEKRDPVYHGR